MDERKNTGMRLTTTALAKIDAAAERLGRSRAAVVEILATLYADNLDGSTMIPAAAVPGDSRQRKTVAKRKRK
jgi:hypothetical protein